jgi:hypothetical protein
MTDSYFLRPSDLLLSYSAFSIYIQRVRGRLSAEELAWLAAWESHDLAKSPMPDEHRRYLRYGHFLGWFDHP